MKKNIKNGTNSEEKVSESITDEDTNIQNEGSDPEIPTNDYNTKSINSEKTIRKSNSKVKIEDYDLIVNSLKDATNSFKDVILSIGKKAQEIRDKAEETFTVGAKRDARDIQALGGYVENVIKGFEDTMTEIKKRNYRDEEKLLKGYKKLLEEQIQNDLTVLIEHFKKFTPKLRLRYSSTNLPSSRNNLYQYGTFISYF
jgi:Mg2+ and Co2+ transporter CorA